MVGVISVQTLINCLFGGYRATVRPRVSVASDEKPGSGITVAVAPQEADISCTSSTAPLRLLDITSTVLVGMILKGKLKGKASAPPLLFFLANGKEKKF